MIISPVHFPTLRVVRSPDATRRPMARHVFSFARGAAALRAGIDALARQRGCRTVRLLAPSYICREALDALPGDAVTVRYYPVQGNLEPDWMALDVLVDQTGGADALLLVHYFSYPNAAARASAWCTARGMSLIEDCAHVLERGSGMGEYGLFSFYSPWKFFPIPTLGTLETNDAAFASCVRRVPPVRHRYRSVCWFGKRIVQHALTATGIRWYAHVVTEKPRTSTHGDGAADHDALILAARGASVRSLIRLQRWENTRTMHTFLRARRPDMLLWSALPQDIALYAFPIIWSEPAARVVGALRKRGIPATTWPALPDVVRRHPERFPVAHRYADRCILLPVHQNVHAQQCEYMLRILTMYL